MAESIEILFGLLTHVGQGCMYQVGAHWGHLANTIKPSMCGGNAAFLSDYSYYSGHLLL